MRNSSLPKVSAEGNDGTTFAGYVWRSGFFVKDGEAFGCLNFFRRKSRTHIDRRATFAGRRTTPFGQVSINRDEYRSEKSDKSHVVDTI